MKSEREVRRQLRRLRAYIDANNANDTKAIERRIAYAVETAIRWAREDGIRGWPNPLEDVLADASLLRKELRFDR